MGRKWATRKKTLKDKWEEDPAKFLYEATCVLLVLAAIVYAIVTGTSPDNEGF